MLTHGLLFTPKVTSLLNLTMLINDCSADNDQHSTPILQISEVLKEELLSLEFWDACAEKGVGVVLSSAASTFPHSYKPLTSICYSLAKNTASCERLVQFASSLSLFTAEVSFLSDGVL